MRVCELVGTETSRSPAGYTAENFLSSDFNSELTKYWQLDS